MLLFFIGVLLLQYTLSLISKMNIKQIFIIILILLVPYCVSRFISRKLNNIIITIIICILLEFIKQILFLNV
jgi:hypothetical protein